MGITIFKKPQSKKSYKTISLRLPRQMIDDMDRLSQQANRSRSELIVQMLQYGLENCVVISEEDAGETH